MYNLVTCYLFLSATIEICIVCNFIESIKILIGAFFKFKNLSIHIAYAYVTHRHKIFYILSPFLFEFLFFLFLFVSTKTNMISRYERGMTETEEEQK